MGQLFNPGLLKRRISIMELQKASDGGGGFDETLVEIASVRAHIQPLFGTEYWANQQTEAKISHKITIRFRPDVKQSQVISYNGKLYDIQYIIDINEQHRFTEIHALERRE